MVRDTTNTPAQTQEAVRGHLLRRYAGAMKWLSVLLVVAALVLFARSLPLEQAVDWLEGVIRGLGVWGAIVFGAIYVLATVLFLPGWILTVAAGAMFGLLWGTVVVSLSSTTGAAVAFLIARYLARDRVARWVAQYPKFEAVDRAIAERGWKIVSMLRLSLAVPFNLQNYLYGLTGIRFWPCVLASWIAMLPGTLVYVYIGYLSRAGLQAGTEEGGPVSVWQWVLQIVGFLATVGVTVYVTSIARKAIREKTAIEEADSSESEQSPRTPSDETTGTGLPMGALVGLVFSLVLLAAAVWCYVNRETVDSYLMRLLAS